MYFCIQCTIFFMPEYRTIPQHRIINLKPLFQLLFGCKMCPTGVYFKKNMVITRGYISAVRWVYDNGISKLVDEIGCDEGSVRTSVVLKQTHSPRQHASPHILNRAVNRLQHLATVVGIDCCTDRQKLTQQYLLSKDSRHHFVGSQCLFELVQLWRI